MLSDIVAMVRKIVRLLLAGNSPRQLAVGFTIGMMIGIMPKENLFALSLCVFMFSIRCNKALGLAAAIAFSFVAPWTDPLAHKIGQYVLTFDSLQTTYASMFNLPLGPWLGFNNTVVAGSFLFGLYIAYPVYWSTCLLFRTIRSLFVSKQPTRLGIDAELQPRAAA
jgi:uncharacterized protein (TIGR03546 family)